MREEVWTKEESAAVDALLAVLIDNQRIAIGGEIRGLLRAAHAAEREKIRKAGELYNMGASIMVPTSVLAPKEKPKEDSFRRFMFGRMNADKAKP
jgi:hypothetical protein